MQTNRRVIRLAVNSTLEKYQVLCAPEIGDAIADAIIEALLSKTQRRQSNRNDLFALACAISDVCHINMKSNSGMIFKEAKLLSMSEPKPTPELVHQHYGNKSTWYKMDWRGKRGQVPAPANIRMTWQEMLIAGQLAGPLVVR